MWMSKRSATTIGASKTDGDSGLKKVLSQIAGKRLTFAELTGKVGETAN
jgi:hypothetical protein